MKTTIPSRVARAKELITRDEKHLIVEFALRDPMPRYLAVEIDKIDAIVEIQHAATLPEMVKLLENSRVESTETEIYDLDTGDILRPDFRRIYRILRVYKADTIVYQAAPSEAL